MSEPTKIDPEPFSIIIGIAGIVGGVASTMAIVEKVSKKSPVKMQRRLKKHTDEVADLIRHVETDVTILTRILGDAEISHESRFSPRMAVFLNKDQFKRYEKTTDELMQLLRKLLKLTNRIDKDIPRLAHGDFDSIIKKIVNIQQRLERVVRDRERTINEVMKDLSTAISDTKGLID